MVGIRLEKSTPPPPPNHPPNLSDCFWDPRVGGVGGWGGVSGLSSAALRYILINRIRQRNHGHGPRPYAVTNNGIVPQDHILVT